MDKFKGTQGEWKIDDDNDVVDETAAIIAIVLGGVREHRQEDSRLIAAAPELLEALISARNYVAGWHAKYDLEESGESLKKCNAAIDKALGK